MASSPSKETKAPLAVGDDSTISSVSEDITSTSSVTVSSETVSAVAHRSYVAKSYLQKNELLTQIQHLRIDFKRKCDELENLKAQHMLSLDERDDKIEELKREICRQRQILDRDEIEASELLKTKYNSLKSENASLTERIRCLESENLRLADEHTMAKQYFRLIRLTEAEYNELKAAELSSKLSLSEQISVRVYEEIRDCSNTISTLTEQNKHLEEERLESRTKLTGIQGELEEKCDECDQLRWAKTRLEKRLNNLLGPGAVTKSTGPESLFEPVPGTTVISSSESDIGVLRSQLDSVTKHLSNERERLICELDSAREALRIAVDDGNTLRRQAIDAGQRSVFLEERVASLTAQIDVLKNGKEQLLEKYLASKENVRTEFNDRLIRELEDLRSKNSDEYERLGRQMKEVFEQEAMSLRNSRDVAVMEKEKAVAAEAEIRSKYEKILVEFKNLEFSLESQTANLISQLRVKTFEMERAKALLDETDHNLKTTKESYESLREKFEALLRDHQNFSSEATFEKKRLTEELDQARHKLTAFEKTETDLDDLVMQAADTPTGNEAERVLISYGAVAAVPPSFRRRLEQSVRLARRVLELEKVNNVLRSDFDKKSAEVSRLGQEVQDLTNLVSISRNPDQKLIVEALKTRDEELRMLSIRVRELEAQLEACRHELMVVCKEKDEMSDDLQTLLENQDEISQIRHQLSMGVSSKGRHLASPTISSSMKSRQMDNRRHQQKYSNRHNISPPVLLH